MNEKNKEATHECPNCGTRYFQAQECDWCPEVTAKPIEPVEQPEAA